MNASEQGCFPSAGTLPVAEPPVPGIETLRQVGVLVVDDQDYLRYTIERTLHAAGFLVWLAESGREAVDLYRRHAAAIDVVVLDVRMPGMDGPQTLAALRELDPHVRCCFLSGDFGCYTEARLREMGAGAVLYKPTQLEKITRAVRLLAGPAGASRPRGERSGDHRAGPQSDAECGPLPQRL
jgi:CheY-like chemotaxis protein